jgi:phosphoglycolate phosphatase
MRLLFDLDGTLTDAGPGIIRCLQHTLVRLGRPMPSASELAWCVGPPLKDSLAEILDGAEPNVIEQALALYRERFVAVGMFENGVYPGVPEGLVDLSEAGHQLWVATAKPHVYARQILAHFGLLLMFAGVYGSELSGEHADKASLIRHFLDAEGRDGDSHMIGDRRHDVEAAHANGLGAVGVLWGYGSRGELEEAGADALVGSMAELTLWAGDPHWTRGR